MDKMKEAQELLQSMKPIVLATTGEGGRPDARMITAVRSEGLKTVWMLTGKCCEKHRELSENPNCMIYAANQGDTEDYLEIRLWGGVEILDDPASRALTWRDEYAFFFPEGRDDPNLAVLKFTAASGILQTIDDQQTLEF